MNRPRLLALVLAGTFALSFIGLRGARTQTGGLRRVTNTSEEGININPSISGDGRILAFESTEDVAHAGGTDHFRAIRANTATDPATSFQMGGTRAVAPAISQDGSRIAFASKDDPLGANPDGNSEILLFDAAKLIQVTNTSPGDVANRVTNGNFQPSITDDGRFIAFSSNRDLAAQNSDGNLEIFVYDTIAGGFTQLTNSSGVVGASDAKISGNGSNVAYIRDAGATPSSKRDLLEQPRVGSGPVNVLASNVQSLAMTYGRAISDDGTRVVYSAETATNSTQVFLFDGRFGAATRQITSLGVRTTEVPLHPTISGDGLRIAFAARRSVSGTTSNSDGSVELYVFDIPSSQVSKITDVPSGVTADVLSSLNDDGSIAAFNFPRILSGAVSNSDSANNSEIYVTGTPARPPFGALTVLNGAAFGKEPSPNKAVAPDSIAVAIGGALANSTQQPQRLPNGTFPTNVGGTTVTVNGRAAQIFFVSPGQVNFLVPPQTEIGTVDVVVTNSENFASRGTVSTLRAAPGVFTRGGDGAGPGVILNSDTLQEGPFDPTSGNLRLTVFTTGARNATQNSVVIGGRVIAAESVIATPDMPGLDEVHVLVPRDLRGAGTVDLFVQSDSRASNPVAVMFIGDSTRDILINEMLSDPPGAVATDVSGDANHDGVRSGSDDEFVELVNTTTHDIDISGYQLLTRSSSTTTDTLRHTFAANTIVPACTAVVVFGGGAFDANNPAFGGSKVVKASSGDLSLSNTGGVVTLRDQASGIVTSLSYGGSTGLNGNAGQSLTRAPDQTGNFVLHQAASGSGGRSFSPGTQLNEDPFALCNTFVRIDVSPSSAAVDAGAKQQFTAKAINANGDEVPGVIFSWQSSNTSVATIDQNGLATSSTAGSTEIRASARGNQSAPATLTVREIPRVLTRIEVTPQSATIPATGAQQFTAKGIDQFGNEITGLTFAWESSNTSAATIDQTGLASGISQGQSIIKATSQSASGTATLNVTASTVSVNEVLADPPTETDGDANHDGTRYSAQDEFVELVNSTNGGINISGWTVRTHSTTSSTETVRHTFAANTTVPAGEAMVVFGGGTFNPANPLFGCAQVVKASSGGLSLTNGGLTILVRDGSANLVTQFSYGGPTGLNGGAAQSLTRSPDITGDFVLHTTIAGARKLSSGLQVNGTPFGSCPGHPATVTISPPANSIILRRTTPLTAQVFDQFGRAMIGVTITFASDNISVATVDSVTTNPSTGIATANVFGHNPGTAHITASATDGTTTANSSQATLTVTGPSLTINDVSLNESDSSTTTFTFTVSLSQPAPTGGVTFDITTQDGTATTVTNDYVARSLTGQTIAAGQSTYTFDVTINGDLNIESNEAFFVNVTNVSGASIGDGQGLGTIINDDSPSLSVSDVSVNEGNGGATIFTFTVTSPLVAQAGGITFDIATADGTGTAAAGDYVARGLTNQTIPTGQTSYTFDVTVNGDTLVEPDETFTVNITNVSGASVTDGSGMGTIQNDDTANLVISQVYGGGDNSGAPFRNDFVEVHNHGTTTVDFSITPYSIQYASVGSNFGADKTNLTAGTIAPGRYFLVQESGGTTNGVALPRPDASGAIAMAGTAGKVALVVGTTALGIATCPGDDGLSPFNPSSTAIFDFVGYGNSATAAGHCYEGPGPAAGPSNTTADFRKAGGCVDTADNASDFFVASPNPRNSSAPIGDCKPEITINDVTVNEGNSGTVNATFTVTLSATSGQTVTMNYATADSTATAPADYQSTSGLLTFNPGDLTRTITVLVHGDALDEPSENFFVNLSNVVNAVLLDGQSRGTINDNDPAPSISINDLSIAEGDSGTTPFTFNVNLSTASGQTVTVNYATADNTAAATSDYQSTSGVLTLSPGDTSKPLTVPVNGDTTFEPNETFFVDLTAATNASISDPQGQGTITSDDAAPPTPTLFINDVSILEGNEGISIAAFSVTLSPSSSQTVKFDYATANGTATTDGNDYQPASGTLTFNPGDTSKPISVTINGDTSVEPDETFTVNLSNAAGGAAIGTPQGTGTIHNDDTANLVISQVYGGGGNAGAPFTNDFIEVFNRGTTTVDLAEWSVQYNSASGTDNWSITPLCPSGPCLLLPGRYFLVREGASGTTDLPPPDGIGTIAMATTSGKVALVSSTTALNGACPSSTNITDRVGYGGTAATTDFCFEGAGPAPAPGNTTADFRKSGGCVDAGNNAADFFVFAPKPRNTSSPANNCTAGIPPNLTTSDVTIAEGNGGTTTATFTVSLSTPAPSTDITFDIATQDNTATTANSDYVLKSLTSQTVPAGQTTYTFGVTVNGDVVIEPDETFFVKVTNVTGATVTNGQGAATIQNDDFPTLSINHVSQNEGDSGTSSFHFTVSLSAPAPTGGVTFDIATQDNSATVADSDYANRNLTGQTIAAGNTSYTFDVTVNGDTNIETDETFFVNVTNISGATLTGGDGQGLGTIQNDDSPVLSINDVSVSEGNSSTTIFAFTVTSSLPAPAGGFTFDIATQDNTATVANNDYAARSLTSQTIPATQTSYTFDVTVNGDTLVEPNENFFVNISNPSGANIGDGQGVGTIQNDDTANLVISQVYGGGNNSGALYQNDFVEIFNRGTTTVDFSVTPYSVQYAGVGSNFGSNKTDLTTGAIAPGHYFLIKELGGTINGVALSSPDASGSIAMGNTSGKVALVVGTAALSAFACPGDDVSSPFNPSDSLMADFVGYGNTVATAGHCYEGAGPATAPGNTTADFRKSGGCIDTNSNAADFLVSGPFPRNTSSPANNCTAGAPPNLTINDVTVTEGNSGTTTATFTVSLSAPTPSTDVTFDIATQNNTATTANNDYVTRTLTNQVIPAGQTTCTFDITVNGDTAVEPDETFFVNVTNVTGATVTDGQGVGTIQNDDLPTLSIDDVSASEGNSGPKTFTFHVSLSAAAPATVTFDIAIADGTAQDGIPGGEDNDYVAHSITAQTIAAGATSFNFDVTVNGDLVIEPNETFSVNVTNVSGATILDGQGQGTIQNDDSPVLSINDVSVSEGNNSTTIFTFTVTSSLPAPAGGFTFDIATQDNTATVANNDYVASSLTSQTIPATQTSYTFDVTVNGDLLVEPNETFFVNISNPAGATIGNGQGVGTIQNDDTANLVISQVYGGGNNSGALYQNDFVEIFNRGTTTVDLAGWSVQYNSASGTENWSVTQLCPSGSCLFLPGRYFLVREGPAGTTNLPAPDATGSIAMATTSGKVTLVSSTTALSGACPSSTSITDRLGYGGTGATTDFCFEGVGPAPAHTVTTADFRKAGGCTDTNGNAADFLVSGPFPRNTSSPANNCVAGTPPNLTINDVTVTEGNSGTTTATFTVSLSAPAPSTDIFFDIATADGTAQDDTPASEDNDYVRRTLTSQVMPAGQTTYAFTVTVNGDNAVEPDETFFVNLTNVTGATVTDGQGVGTIQHDDLPTLSIDDVSASEGNSLTKTFTFHVTLSAAAPATVTFDIATADGTAQDGIPGGEDNDYVAHSITAQTIAAGGTSFDFDVTVNGDLVIEPNEIFFVNVTNVSGATILDGQGQGTIQNDDSPALSIDDVAVSEGNSSTTTLTFTVTSSLPAPAGGFTFDIATQDNTATVANNDYVASSLTSQTIPATQTSYTFDVTVNGDLLVEPNETFFVNISNPAGATIGNGQGVGTIQNDDTANLVISQVYGGGGNTTSVYQHDFVEIFNRGTTTVDFSLTPYSVQYAGTSSNFGSSKTDLTTGTMAPGQYFLIQESAGTSCSGSPCGIALPTPDAIGIINLAGTSGKVALVAGTTSLSAATCPGDDGSVPFNPSNLAIADFAGYGSTPGTAGNCYEGAGPAPAPNSSNTNGVLRAAAGCTDTNENAADHATGNLNPRNTATPLHDCNAPPTLTSVKITPSPATIGVGDTQQFTGQASDQFGQPIGGVTVSFASNDTNVATVDSVSSTSGTGSATATVTGRATGSAEIRATATNGSTNATSSPATLTVEPAAGQVLISEFRTRGPAPGNAADEFIEIYNPTTSAVIIGGLLIRSSNNAGSLNTRATIPAGVTLDPGCHYLFAPASFSGSGTVPPDQSFSSGITDDGGIAITRSDLVTVLDAVGMSAGSAYKEGTPLAPLAGTSNQSYERKPGGASGNGVDTNSNTNDFVLNSASSNPQNFSSGCLATNTADLSITKTDSPDPMTVGSDITYTLTVTNNGIGVAQSVVVTDNLPSSLTYVSCNSTGGGVCSGTGNNRSVNFSSLAVGSSAIITLVATVNGTGGGTISNTASVSAATSDPNSSNDSSTATTTVSSADLSITKSDSPDPVNAGENITYTLIVTNNSSTIPAQSVTVTDQVPANTTFVSVATTPAGWTRTDSMAVGQSGTVTYTRPTLAANGTATFTITVKVDSNAANNSTISNTANVTSNTPDDNTGNNSQTITTTVRTPADLSLTKTVNNPSPNVGGEVTFTITVSNSGPYTATGVSVKDQLPAGLIHVSDDGAGAYVDGTGIWTVGTVNASAAATLHITAQATSAAVNGVANTAEVVASDQFDPDSTPINHNSGEDDQANVSVTAQSANLSLTKTVDNSSPNVAQDVTFTITLNNAGPNAATSVQVKDLLPAGLTFVSSAQSQGSYISSSGIWTVGSVNASGSATLTITATVQSAGTTTNTAEVIASDVFDPDSTPNNNNATEDDQASRTISSLQADLSLLKSVDNATPNVGDNVVFTITVSNAGPSPATNVQVNDLLPGGLTYVSDDGGGAYTSGTGIWTVGTVNASATATLDITATVTSASINGVTNTAEITASDVPDPDSTPNNQNASEDDQKSVTVNAKDADLAITKGDSPDPVLAGGNITYTINVTNDGPDTSFNSTLSDSVPGNTTFQSLTPATGWTCTNPTVGGTGAISCTAASLAASQTDSFALVVKVNSGVAGGTIISNTASVSSSTTFDPTSGNNSVTQTTTVQPSADLSITKTDSPDPVAVGNDITHTITVTNGGPDAAASAALSDTVPTNTTFRSLTFPLDWTCTQPAVASTGSISCTNPSFAAGSAVLTLVVRVGVSVADGTSISNTASVSSSTFDPDTGNNSATETTTAKTPLLVISQVYGGGGNSGATYRNDFIEIYNRGTTTVDFSVTPYSVQYAAATSAFGTFKTDITSGTIAPGEYFLIQEFAPSSPAGADLPTSDATGTINLNANAGKVALVLGTVLLSGNCSADSSIVDLVGFGFGTTTGNPDCFEGSARITTASATNNARSILRDDDGCEDTNDNAANFTYPVTAPVARNRVTAVNPCP